MEPSGYCHRKLFSCSLPLCLSYIRSLLHAQFVLLQALLFSLTLSTLLSAQLTAFLHLENRTGKFDLFRITQSFSFLDQALDLLVSSTFIRYRTPSDDLSTSSSLRGLTYFHSGSLILQGGFTLRCLQRLSLPHFASLLCPWQNNSFTRGASIPVLSY